jgi:hypothetical protein
LSGMTWFFRELLVINMINPLTIEINSNQINKDLTRSLSGFNPATDP